VAHHGSPLIYFIFFSISIKLAILQNKDVAKNGYHRYLTHCQLKEPEDITKCVLLPYLHHNLSLILVLKKRKGRLAFGPVWLK
jgi:hypothetical protein